MFQLYSEISVHVQLIAVCFCTYNHVPQRINTNDFGDPLFLQHHHEVDYYANRCRFSSSDFSSNAIMSKFVQYFSLSIKQLGFVYNEHYNLTLSLVSWLWSFFLCIFPYIRGFLFHHVLGFIFSEKWSKKRSCSSFTISCLHMVVTCHRTTCEQ